MSPDESGQRCAAPRRVCMQCIQRTKEIQALRAEVDRLRQVRTLHNADAKAPVDYVIVATVGAGLLVAGAIALWILGRIAAAIGGAP